MSDPKKRSLAGEPQRQACFSSMPAPFAQAGWQGPEAMPRIAGLAFWVWDVKAETCCFSPEWQSILRSPQEGAGEASDAQWWWRRIHEEDAEAVRLAVRDILDGKIQYFDLLFRLQRADDCWTWLLSRGGVSAQGDGGQPAKVSGVVVDVSRLRADGKFQQGACGVMDAGYHAMLENSPDFYVRMDRELFPSYINPVVARYMARERDEYSYNETLDDLKIDPAQLEFLQKNVSRVFDEGVTVREMVSFTTAYDTEVTGEYSFWPEYDADGKIVYAMTHFRDLTEQVRAEQRARLNEQRLDALYRLTQMEDAQGAEVLEFVMDSLLRLTKSGSGFIFIPDGPPTGKGYMLWSADHYRYLDNCHLPDDVFPPDLVSLVTDEGGDVNYRSVRNGDGIQPVHVSFDGNMPVMRSIIAPALEGDRIVCIAGVCNKASDYEESDLQQLETFINGAWLILRRRRYVQELHRAKEAAEHASKAKDEFLANVSHELRTPLNGILSMLQLLDLLPLTKEQRDYVRAASSSGKALMRIISDILDFSRMESGAMRLQAEPFDLKGTLDSTLQLFRTEAQSKGLAFTVIIDPAIPDRLLGDDARVRQIVFNIVGNAIKFTEHGGVRVECSLLGANKTLTARVYLGVHDTGIGIPLEEQERIFEAFTQVDSSSTRKYAGTGLGLSIVKRLVSLMDGAVTVESEVGVGTSIHCSLAFGRAPFEAAAPVVAAPVPLEGGVPMDILVAEDDEVGRFAIRSLLQRGGHRTVCVNNGRQALEALRLHPFHCLFTDIQMPDMDGLEVAEHIRSGSVNGVEPSEATRALLRKAFPESSLPLVAVDREIPIVAVSAHAMAGDRERFLQKGINFYISKPVVVENLAEVLSQIARSQVADRAAP